MLNFAGAWWSTKWDTTMVCPRTTGFGTLGRYPKVHGYAAVCHWRWRFTDRYATALLPWLWTPHTVSRISHATHLNQTSHPWQLVPGGWNWLVDKILLVLITNCLLPPPKKKSYRHNSKNTFSSFNHYHLATIDEPLATCHHYYPSIAVTIHQPSIIMNSSPIS